jgi:hypothetical protein
VLTEREQAYCHRLIKMYRFLAKVALIPMAIPVAGVCYHCWRGGTVATVRLETLVTEIVLFVAVWTGFMSFHIKADVIRDILRGLAPAEAEDQPESSPQDQP